ncbi:DoxX family protein [Nocardia harenae]|uniref:DoxX family protein n=1 Tax=Nocardia harenae TaxID=358707 RepID=UPI00082B1070|nr:DoxX family protein [Nocardia harenae]
MNIALWIAAALLAVVALVGGVTKTVVPISTLAAAPGGAWTGRTRPAAVRTLGGLELLAALGLVLPPILGIVPVLVPVTALCWVLLMLGAMATHHRLREYPPLALNALYLTLAAFVAWGRSGPYPF